MSAKRTVQRLLGPDAGWAWLFLLPSVVGIAVFNLLPVIGSFWLSLTRWNLLGTPRFVGLANYADLFADSRFYRVMGQTLGFVGLTVTLDVALGLLLAVALNRKLRGRGLLRTAYFLPYITSMVAIAIVWGWLFDPRFGALNLALKAFGLAPVYWLSDPRWAMPSIVLVTVWKGLGYTMMLFLAGLQAIPGHYEEAAMLDGASAPQRFFGITLPLLSPTVFLVTTVSLINAFQAFDAVYMLTGGGPMNQTNVIVYWLYQNAFTYFNMGKASAIAYVLFAVILAITLVQWGLRKRWVVYE
ncbi:MAG TPA: sugar ABC transporter permease [Pantanalinema sp.]